MKKIAIIAAAVVAGSVFWWSVAEKGEAESIPLQQEERSPSRIAEAVSARGGGANLPARGGKDFASPLPEGDEAEEPAEPQTEEENVKKPILQEILRDKSHPCWADTEWILDVTGELPGK